MDVSAGVTTTGAHRVLRRAFSRAAPRPEIMLTGAPGTERIPGRRSEVDYTHVIQRIGEVIDGAGAAIILVGTAIAAGAPAVRLGHHQTGTYRRFRQLQARQDGLAWSCRWPSAVSAPSPPRPLSLAWRYPASSS